jgi:hypothetical protein
MRGWSCQTGYGSFLGASDYGFRDRSIFPVTEKNFRFRIPQSGTSKNGGSHDRKGKTMFISVKRFAELHEVSDRYIRKLIQQGKITELSWKRRGRGYLIDQAKAEQDMADNISGWAESRGLSSEQVEPEPMPKTWFYQGQGRNTAERIQIQEQAADIASEDEEPGPGGYMVPLPIWDIHYIAALFNLDPDRVTIERISKTEWRLKVHDLDNESGEPCPWTVDLSFDFQPGWAEG